MPLKLHKQVFPQNNLFKTISKFRFMQLLFLVLFLFLTVVYINMLGISRFICLSAVYKLQPQWQFHVLDCTLDEEEATQLDVQKQQQVQLL